MAYLRQNSVQKKVGCVFKIKIEDKASEKRQNQPFRVTASDDFSPDVEDHDLETAKATEKLDGTCCYISEYEGKPWLWARLDRKPNKAGDKKLKRHLAEKDSWRENGEVGDPPQINWNVMTDFKDVPENWRPALEVPVVDGVAQPDSHGHIPGWVPVNPAERQHVWHLTTVDLTRGLGLLLSYSEDDGLQINCVRLSEHLEETVELIGTNVNGNPYKLGTRQQPVHLLVVHGCIPAQCPQPVTRESLVNWLENSPEGRVEGIVWHCPTGALFKVHRNHLGLSWPIENTFLSKRKVKINVDGAAFKFEENMRCLFYLMSRHKGSSCEHLLQLHDLIYNQSRFGRNAGIAIGVAVGVIAIPVAVPVALGAAGFGAGGVIAGSIAARLMSAAAIANGGGVAAGSAVAVAQSIGAAGLGATGTAVASTVGGAIGGAAMGLYNRIRRN